MPITKTASISPGSACSPSTPSYTWTDGQGATVGSAAVLSVNTPGLYTASVNCATSPALCRQQSSSYVMCYQGANITTAFSSFLNIVAVSPTGVLTNLNTVAGFSFPYANTDAGAAALKAALIAWAASNNGNGAEVISLKSGQGIVAILSSWSFSQVITNIGPTGFSITCTAPTFSVSAANTSTGPPPVLGQATGTPSGCSSFVRYTWYNPSGANVGETNPASLTRGITYTLRAFCGDGQWASTTVLVT